MTTTSFRLLAFGLVFAGLMVRAAAIPWGLPYLHHPDEPTNIAIVHRLVAERTLNPEFFNYPSLMFEVQAAAHAVVNQVAQATGCIETVDDLWRMDHQTMANARLADPLAVLVGRSITVVFSLATILLVGFLALRLTAQPLPALVAMAALGFSDIGVRNAALVTPDTYAGFFALAAVAGCLGILRRGSTLSYLAAGAAVGLAAGSKYNAALLALLVPAAHLFRHGPAVFASRRGWLQLSASGVAAVVAFAPATPYAFVDPEVVQKALRVVNMHYRVGHFGHEGQALVSYVAALARSEAFVLLFAPLALLNRRLVKESTLLLMVVVGYVLFIGRYEVHFARNLTPIVPILALLAGVALAGLMERASPPAGKMTVAILVLALVLPQAVRTVAQVSSRPTNERATAMRWFDVNIKPGSVVLVDAFSPWIDPERFEIHAPPRFFSVHATSDADILAADVIVIADEGSGLALTDPGRYAGEIARIGMIRQRSCATKRIDSGEYWVEFFVLNCEALLDPA